MEDIQHNSTQSQNIIQANLMNEIENLKKINNLEELKLMIDELNEIKGLSMIQKFIILFFSHYNHLTSKTGNNIKLIQLSTFMIDNFTNKDILSLVQKEIIINFYEDFKNYKIFSDNSKKYNVYEICFSICFLSRKIEIFVIFFNNYLNLEIFDANEYDYLNLDNLVILTLLDNIFNIFFPFKKLNRYFEIKINLLKF